MNQWKKRWKDKLEKDFELGKNLKYKGLEVKWEEKKWKMEKAIKKIKRREE